MVILIMWMIPLKLGLKLITYLLHYRKPWSSENKPGKEKQSLSCKQTLTNACADRLWGDGEGGVREFCLGSKCEQSARWLGIHGHHSEYEVIKNWLMKHPWTRKRKIWAGLPPLQMHNDYLHACMAGVKSTARDVVLQFIQRKIF